MKQSKRRLEAVLRILNAEDYYSISFDTYHVRLQGSYTAEKLKNIRKAKFKMSETRDNGYIDLERNGVKIVLTD